MKKVLVYPAGTEIALEIFRSVKNSIHFDVYGGSSSYDHGVFVYKKHIDDLPFITDNSTKEDVLEFIEKIKSYDFDFIYPATDSVVYKFSEFKELFKETIITPDFFTVGVARSKNKAYSIFKNIINVPLIYDENNVKFPCFIKPDVGQGAVGARVVNSQSELEFYLKNSKKRMLVLEYLPGVEYTIDCFTNNDGKLIFAQPRTRKRIKSGISVNTYNIKDNRFYKIAQKINEKLHQRGGWFFQLKERENGELVLLEVASRIAGSSEITRANGVNLPLMTLHLFNMENINSVICNNLQIEADRALASVYKLDLQYNTAYVDYDDTVIINDNINIDMIKFIYQSINKNVKVILITRHDGDIDASLKQYRLERCFDEVIKIDKTDSKHIYIKDKQSIFIDDSYKEREEVKKYCNIPTFSPQEIECLIERV